MGIFHFRFILSHKLLIINIDVWLSLLVTLQTKCYPQFIILKEKDFLRWQWQLLGNFRLKNDYFVALLSPRPFISSLFQSYHQFMKCFEVFFGMKVWITLKFYYIFTDLFLCFMCRVFALHHTLIIRIHSVPIQPIRINKVYTFETYS